MPSKLWSFTHLVSFPIFKVLLGLRIKNTEFLPKKGSFIIAANHQSNFDPPVVAFSIFPNECYFIAKEDLFNIHPLYSLLLKTYHTIKISRNKRDIKAFKEGLNKIRNGFSLIVFPEGTRKKTDHLEDIRAGAAFFSIKSNVPMIPCYVNYRNLSLSSIFKGYTNINVIFGKPIIPKKDIKTVSKIALEMAELWKKQMEELCR